LRLGEPVGRPLRQRAPDRHQQLAADSDNRLLPSQLAFHPLECRLPVAVAASGMLGDLVHRRTQVQPPGFGDAAVSVDLALSWTSAPSPP